MGMDPCLNRSPALLATPVQINAQARAADELLPIKEEPISSVFVLTLTDFDCHCIVSPKKFEKKKKYIEFTGCALLCLCGCVCADGCVFEPVSSLFLSLGDRRRRKEVAGEGVRRVKRGFV